MEMRNTKSILLRRLLWIPEEILMNEILPRLPVKSLSRFKCVSKSWQSLIESDRFIKMQYLNSARYPRVIFTSNSYAMEECSLQWLLNSKEGSDPTKNEARVGTLVGCCNGIVCCYDSGGGRFWLLNPAIRVSIELPDNGDLDLFFISKYGFGWDETSGAYKVFALLTVRDRYEKIGRVYSSNTNSWKTIPGGSLSLSTKHGMFLRGNLHWFDWCHSQIECFDLEREEFGRIEIPLENATNFPLLGEIGKRLSILVDLKKNLEVWVMKEYGVKDSWFKLLMFPPTFFSIRTIYTCYPLFGEGPNGEIFVCHGENLAVYSPKDDAFSMARNYVDFIAARLYVESLVSPKRIFNSLILTDATTNTTRKFRLFPCFSFSN